MADLASSPYFLLILFIAAFALPLVYLVWIRNSPRYGREPWPTVLKTFAWGAVFSVIIAIILSVVFILVLGQIQSLNDFFARRFQDPSTALGALVVAPIVEGAAKGVGATAGRPQTQSKTHGLGEPCDCRDLRRAVEARLASVPHVTVRPGTSSRNVITPDGVQVGACAFVSKCRGTRTRRTRSPSSESSQGTGFVGVVVWTVHSGRAGANG